MGKKKDEIQWEVGIDEAGRGPLAGPVAVGVVLIPADFEWRVLPGVGDSKAMSEQKREEVYKQAKQLEKAGILQCMVVMGSAKQIDKKGIAVVIREGIEKGLKKIKNSTFTNQQLTAGLAGGGARVGDVSPRSFLVLHGSTRKDLGLTPGQVLVKLDGGLRAPAEWVHQETIIKGDAKEKVIGLASIMAKVTRDAYMRRRATLAAYTPYNFARHKGYGTEVHREAIAKYGLSPEHRHTFCKKFGSVV